MYGCNKDTDSIFYPFILLPTEVLGSSSYPILYKVNPNISAVSSIVLLIRFFLLRDPHLHQFE